MRRSDNDSFPQHTDYPQKLFDLRRVTNSTRFQQLTNVNLLHAAPTPSLPNLAAKDVSPLPNPIIKKLCSSPIRNHMLPYLPSGLGYSPCLTKRKYTLPTHMRKEKVKNTSRTLKSHTHRSDSPYCESRLISLSIYHSSYLNQLSCYKLQ